MDRKTLYHIVEWSIALAACAFLVWKIATYEDYAALGATLRGMGWQQWGAVILCIALMPVNMFLEAWRWYSLMNDGTKELVKERLSFREAQRQVYYSKLAGLITPWRLGEYPSRALMMSQEIQDSEASRESAIWAKVLSMGAVGSATMTAVILACGLLAMMMYGVWCMVYTYYLLIVALILVLLGLALYFAPRLLRRWADVSHRLVVISLAQSFVRLLCWCVQLGLVLWALGAINHLPCTIYNLFVYYLLVTVTPNVPIAEAGVRGAWAIVVFGSMNAAMAGVLLWIINTLLPCVVWLFLRKT